MSTLSCSQRQENDSPILLPYGNLFDSSLKEEEAFKKLTYSGFSSMVKEKNDSSANYDSFFLVVRGSSQSCLCWINVRENLARYMKKNNLLTYLLTLSDDFVADGKERDYKGLNLKRGEQTIAIFENGALKYQMNLTEGSEYSKDYEKFEAYLDSHLKVGNVLYISKKQLDALYQQGDGAPSFVVGFTRNSCPDCTYINRHRLKEIASSEEYNVSYLFDCDTEGVRLYKGEEAKENGSENAKIAYQNWITFKNDHGLSDVENKELGYKEGYVPTWTCNLPGLSTKIESIKDMFVWGNDSIIKNGDIYEVATTYFDGSREHAFLSDKSILDKSKVNKTNLKGLEVPKSELNLIGETPYWTHEASSKYEDPLLTAFFNYYCSKK